MTRPEGARRLDDKTSRRQDVSMTRHLDEEARGGRIIAAPAAAMADSGRTLQMLVAFAVVAAALLNPLHAAVAVTGLVGVVLVDAGVHAGLAGGLLAVFRIDGIRKDGVADGSRCRGSRRGSSRSRRRRRRGGRARGCVRAALRLAEIIPLLAVQGAGCLGRLILR